MSNNGLMMRFKNEMFAPNGKREMSSTSDVDAALANAILDIFSGMQVSDSRQSAKPLAQFLTRTARDQLKIGQFNDVETFLRVMRQAKGVRKDDESTSVGDINRDSLPVINLGRSPGFQPHDNSVMSADYNVGGVSGENGQTVALLSLMPIEISYTIMVLANEKETLNSLVAAIASWLYQFAAYGATHFSAQSQIAGVALTLECAMRNPKAVIIEDLSGQINNDRVFACSIPITVIAPLFTAWLGTPSTGAFEVYSNGVSYTTIAPAVLPPQSPVLFELV